MANFFKTRRANANLTQQQIADACGVMATTISAWERGIAVPRPQYWETLAKLFGCPMSLIAKAVHTQSLQRKSAPPPPASPGTGWAPPSPSQEAQP